MRTELPYQLTEGRMREGKWATSDSDGVIGTFIVRGPTKDRLLIISSGLDPEFMWEHVQVSTRARSPTWDEMCFVKNLFWHEEECVVQFHPPKSKYVNCHPHCLHLWRLVGRSFPMPPSMIVGSQR
jgi:hypothetical protein